MFRKAQPRYDLRRYGDDGIEVAAFEHALSGKAWRPLGERRIRLVTRRTRWWLAIAGLAASVAVAVAFGVRVSREAEPRFREELERWLSARLNSDVRLDSLDVQLRPALRVEGTNLVLRIAGRPDLPPFITIARVSGRGGFTTLRAKRLSEVRLEGVEINVPPGRRADLDALRQAGRGAGSPAEAIDVPAPPFIIERLVADSISLTVMPREPARDAQQWDIRDLVMQPFSLDAAMPFRATIDTPLPGERAGLTGTVGPWPRDDFHLLPVTGEYTFAGDVSTVPGLDGRLDATGTILGTIDRLATHGTVTSPAIGLSSNDAGRLTMSTTYEAVFDGTNGDLFLTRAATALADSTFETSGRVTRVQGTSGRHLSLVVKTRDRADVADVLRLLVDGARPPLSGQLSLDATLELPPGASEVLDRIVVDGTFRLARTRFANPDVQGKVDELSRRGQGRPADVAVAQVPSDMRGRVRLHDRRLTLSSVVFAAPGATIAAAGSYGIATEQLRFRGVARLDAAVSRTQTGARRLLLRPLDPWLAQQGAGTRLVMDVRGTRLAPVVDLDLGATLRGRR